MAYEPQEGIWTLTAPDGRQWTGASGLLAAAAEQRERIPADVQLKRIFAGLEPTQDEIDAGRYRWLRNVGDATRRPFALRDGYSAEMADKAIDDAMLKTPNVEVTGAARLYRAASG